MSFPATTTGYGSRALAGTRHVIALDLGGTKLAGGLVERDGTVSSRLDLLTDQSGQEALVEQIEGAIESLAGPTVAALGIGLPSLIDQRTGRVGSSVNVPLAGLELRERLARRFGLPVALENDANAAAVAEHRLGAGRGTRHMVLLTLGTGIGGGLVLNGELYRGAFGAAGELGHITVDLSSGLECQGFCPGVGHLESLASGTAAARRAEAEADADPGGSLARARDEGRTLDGEVVVELARAGDAAAIALLDTVGRDLGVGLANYVNVFNPELIVVGGGFGAAGELLLASAREVVAHRALPTARDEVRIVEAELGPDAGLVGSGLVGFDLV